MSNPRIIHVLAVVKVYDRLVDYLNILFYHQGSHYYVWIDIWKDWETFFCAVATVLIFLSHLLFIVKVQIKESKACLVVISALSCANSWHESGFSLARLSRGWEARNCDKNICISKQQELGLAVYQQIIIIIYYIKS